MPVLVQSPDNERRVKNVFKFLTHLAARDVHIRWSNSRDDRQTSILQQLQDVQI